MTMEDLRRYRPTWSDPIRVDYKGYQVCLPSGGGNIAGMLHLLELSKLSEMGFYTESPESLFWFHRIIEAVDFGTNAIYEVLKRFE